MSMTWHSSTASQQFSCLPTRRSFHISQPARPQSNRSACFTRFESTLSFLMGRRFFLAKAAMPTWRRIGRLGMCGWGV